jgi:hypothetical protein
LNGRIKFPHGRKEEVFGTDVLTAHGTGLFRGVFQHGSCSFGRGNVAEDKRTGQAGDFAFYGMPEFGQIDSQKFEGFTGNPAAVLEERDNRVFRQKLVRIEAPRFFLGVDGQ